MRPSATVEELSLLDFIAYDIYGDNIPDFKTLGINLNFRGFRFYNFTC